MGRLEYKISYNDSVNRWWITDMQKTSFDSPCEAFEADVNLGEAYVQIVYPVRREFCKRKSMEEVKLYQGTYDRVYFPFENNRVDFTTFLHMPHHIWVNGKTEMFVEETGEYPFEIYTCGGLKAWVNGKEAFCFTPYTRNIPGKECVSLYLKKGLNRIEIYADELAERDVFFYFEFRYKGRQQVKGSIELGDYVEEVLDAERFLKSCYFPRDIAATGDVILQYDNSYLKMDKKLRIMGDEQLALLNNVEIEGVQEVVARKDHKQVSLGKVTDYNVGVFTVLLVIQTGTFSIIRNLVEGILPADDMLTVPGDTEKNRKRQALKFICAQGENVVNRTLAILETEKVLNDKALRGLNYSLKMIENHEDCADFYLPPMLLLITRYRKYISDTCYEKIKHAILNFRYWIDEPGNDVMWYFSENHALLFHIGQYLAGCMFQEDMFTASKKSGREQYVLGRQRVEAWFHTFFKYGFAEWNSGTYIPVDLVGFFILYQMAPDQEIQNMSKKAIDDTFRLMIYNTYGGVMCCSYGRAYEDTLKVRKLMQPNFFMWTGYGQGYLTSSSGAVALYCLSEYKAPACFEEGQPRNYEWISLELDQGINRVKTFGFKTKDYFLSCVRRFKSFEHGHQQHLMNVAFGEKCIQYFINHPGERPFSGGNRPSYWAGNGTIPFIEQYKNIMLMLFQIHPDELVHYIHAYTPFYEYDEYESDEHWLFMRSGEAYVGTWFSNGHKLTMDGANTGKEIISYGLNHGVVIRCGSAAEFREFELFKRSMKKALVLYDGELNLQYQDPVHGKMEINNINRVYAGGKDLTYEPAPELRVLKGTINKIDANIHV